MKKHFILIALTITAPFLTKAQSTWTSGTSTLTTTAKVGVGTTTPTGQLHVATNSAGTWTTGLKIDNWGTPGLGGATGNLFAITHTPNTFPTGATQQLFAVDLNQTWIGNKLRIGATAANGTYASYTLSVAGSMIAKQCVIETDSWADFVFNKDYSLPSLNSVEAYVKENNHLPGVPSEAEVKANGVDMGQMNKILMQKVEELTLYMIDLQKENKEIKDQLAQLKDKN